ncbi:unnamed protein product, partial [Cylindrotheca closterium]
MVYNQAPEVFTTLTDRMVYSDRGELNKHHPPNQEYLRIVRSNRVAYRAIPDENRSAKKAFAEELIDLLENQRGFIFVKPVNGKYVELAHKKKLEKVMHVLRELRDPFQPEVVNGNQAGLQALADVQEDEPDLDEANAVVPPQVQDTEVANNDMDSVHDVKIWNPSDDDWERDGNQAGFQALADVQEEEPDLDEANAAVPPQVQDIDMNPFDDVANVELGNPFPDWQFSAVHLRGIEQLPQQPGFEAAGHQNEIVVTDNQIVEAMELLLQPV